MAKTPRKGAKGSQDDYDGREPYEREPLDDPDEHLEIERRRFIGSEPPTPERYARAREQWSRLPGALSRPPMGEGIDPGHEPPKTPTDGKKNGDGGER
jgi:hypothetical protein